jgi:hypothetical protein
VSNSAPACKGAPKAPKPTRNTASEDAQARLALIFTGYAIPLSQDVWLTPQHENYPTLRRLCVAAVPVAQRVERRASTCRGVSSES